MRTSLLVLITHGLVGVRVSPRPVPSEDLKKATKAMAASNAAGELTQEHALAAATNDALAPRNRKQPLLYFMLVGAAIARLRFPKILAAARRSFGFPGAAVARILVQHGMLGAEAVVELATGESASIVAAHGPVEDGEGGASGGAGGDGGEGAGAGLLIKAEVRAALEKMMECGAVLAAPDVTVPEGRKAGADTALAMEKSARGGSGRSPAKRPRLGRSGSLSGGGGAGGDSGEDGAEGFARDHSGENQATVAGNKVAATLAALASDDGGAEGRLLRLSVAYWSLQERDDDIVRLAAERFDDPAALVVRAVVDLGLQYAKSYRTGLRCGDPHPDLARIAEAGPAGLADAEGGCLPGVTAKDILNYLENAFEGETLSWESTKKKLTALTTADPPLLRMTTDAAQGSVYSVAYDQVVAQLKEVTLAEIAVHRQGDKAGRVVRLLRDRKYLEDKAVADICKMEAKDARAMLYGLREQGIVRMVEVPYTAERQPFKTAYLWTVDVTAFADLTTEDCCRTILNLRLRGRHLAERQQRNQTAGLDSAGAAAAGGGAGDGAAPPDAEHKVRRAIDQLHASVLAVEETLRLFTDW